MNLELTVTNSPTYNVLIAHFLAMGRGSDRLRDLLIFEIVFSDMTGTDNTSTSSLPVLHLRFDNGVDPCVARGKSVYDGDDSSDAAHPPIPNGRRSIVQRATRSLYVRTSVWDGRFLREISGGICGGWYA
jgi:hypothetical protein